MLKAMCLARKSLVWLVVELVPLPSFAFLSGGSPSARLPALAPGEPVTGPSSGNSNSGPVSLAEPAAAVGAALTASGVKIAGSPVGSGLAAAGGQAVAGPPSGAVLTAAGGNAATGTHAGAASAAGGHAVNVSFAGAGSTPAAPTDTVPMFAPGVLPSSSLSLSGGGGVGARGGGGAGVMNSFRTHCGLHMFPVLATYSPVGPLQTTQSLQPPEFSRWRILLLARPDCACTTDGFESSPSDHTTTC